MVRQQGSPNVTTASKQTHHGKKEGSPNTPEGRARSRRKTRPPPPTTAPLKPPSAWAPAWLGAGGARLGVAPRHPTVPAPKQPGSGLLGPAAPPRKRRPLPAEQEAAAAGSGAGAGRSAGRHGSARVGSGVGRGAPIAPALSQHLLLNGRSVPLCPGVTMRRARRQRLGGRRQEPEEPEELEVWSSTLPWFPQAAQAQTATATGGLRGWAVRGWMAVCK